MPPISRPLTGNSRSLMGLSRPNLNSALSSNSNGKDANNALAVKKFYEPCYKRCPCLMHGEKVKCFLLSIFK